MGFRIQLLMDYELGRSKIMMEENQSSFQRSYGFMAFLALLGVFILYWRVSGHLQRTVSKPLKLLVAHMRGIARGDGNMSQRLEVIGRDEIAEVSEAFNSYLQKLQSFDEMKISLISVVSHQLKTPVAEINGYIESMLDGLTGELSEKQKDYLQDMKEIGRDNYRLISDLLSVSKIERGVLSLNVQKVSVKKVVELSIRDYEESIRRKGLALKIDMPEDDFLILADQDKTVETIRNLINNAIKCTDRGSITITVWNRPDQAIILVRDTGIGMNAQTMERLFTKSRALGREATRAGAGLGLYIARHFMKLQKSEISVTSEVGVGSCFEIAIPKFKLAEREAV
jgi:signal transduction histidine kinase